MQKRLLAFVLTTALFIPNVAPKPINTDQVKAFAKDAAWLYAKDWTALIAHELGHAIAGKILLDAPLKISLGRKNEKTSFMSPKFSYKNNSVTLTSILPVAGWTDFPHSTSWWRNVAITLAGPIAGSITYYLLNVLENGVKRYKKDKPLSIALLKDAFLEPDVYFHLFGNLFLEGENDGAQILKTFFPKLKTDHLVFTIGQGAACFIAALITCEIIQKQLPKTERARFAHTVNLKSGNRFLMQCANNTASTLANYFSEDNFEFEDIDFKAGDLVGLAAFLQSYPDALQYLYT